jgi:RNA polymerase-binding transcription factor DksA
MTKAEIDSYRRRLLTLKKRLGRQLSDLEKEALRPVGGEASGGLSNVPLHPADLGNDSYEEEVALDLLKNEKQILTEIEDALKRIEQGAFGRCAECGQEIPKERLDAVPWTRYCRRHAQEVEARAGT